MLLAATESPPDGLGLDATWATVHECSPEQFLAQCSGWFDSLLSDLQVVDDFHRISAKMQCLCLAKLLTRAYGYSSAVRELTTSGRFTKLFNLLIKLSVNQLSIECLLLFLATLRNIGINHQHVESTRRLMLSCLSTSTHAQQRILSAQCLAALTFVQSKNSWNQWCNAAMDAIVTKLSLLDRDLVAAHSSTLQHRDNSVDGNHLSIFDEEEESIVSQMQRVTCCWILLTQLIKTTTHGGTRVSVPLGALATLARITLSFKQTPGLSPQQLVELHLQVLDFINTLVDVAGVMLTPWIKSLVSIVLTDVDWTPKGVSVTVLNHLQRQVFSTLTVIVRAHGVNAQIHEQAESLWPCVRSCMSMDLITSDANDQVQTSAPNTTTKRAKNKANSITDADMLAIGRAADMHSTSSDRGRLSSVQRESLAGKLRSLVDLVTCLIQASGQLPTNFLLELTSCLMHRMVTFYAGRVPVYHAQYREQMLRLLLAACLQRSTKIPSPIMVASRIFNDGISKETDVNCVMLCQQGAQVCLHVSRPVVPAFDTFDATRYNAACTKIEEQAAKSELESKVLDNAYQKRDDKSTPTRVSIGANLNQATSIDDDDSDNNTSAVIQPFTVSKTTTNESRPDAADRVSLGHASNNESGKSAPPPTTVISSPKSPVSEGESVMEATFEMEDSVAELPISPEAVKHLPLKKRKLDESVTPSVRVSPIITLDDESIVPFETTTSVTTIIKPMVQQKQLLKVPSVDRTYPEKHPKSRDKPLPSAAGTGTDDCEVVDVEAMMADFVGDGECLK